MLQKAGFPGIINPALYGGNFSIIDGTEFLLAGSRNKSYPGSGEKWFNISLPSSGIDPSEYDCYLGDDATTDGDEPTFDTDKFVFDGNDNMALIASTIPDFIKEFHRTDKTTECVWLAVAFNLASIASYQALCGNANSTASDHGFNISVTNTGKLQLERYNASGSASYAGVSAVTLETGKDYVAIVQLDKVNDKLKFWVSSTVPALNVITPAFTATSDASNTFVIGESKQGSRNLLNGGVIYGITGGYEELTSTKITAILDFFEQEHDINIYNKVGAVGFVGTGSLSVSGSVVVPLPSGAVFNVDATELDTYDGVTDTGDAKNAVASPSDSSSQAQYDFEIIGATHNGTPGDPSCYFGFNGSSFLYPKNANTDFQNKLHRTDNSDWWTMVVGFRTPSSLAGSAALCATSNNNSDHGMALYYTGSDLRLFMRDGTGTVKAFIIDDTIVSDTDYLLVVSCKPSTREVKAYLNNRTATATGNVASYTSTTDATDDRFYIASQTTITGLTEMWDDSRLYNVTFFNLEADVDGIYDHFESKHDRTYAV